MEIRRAARPRRHSDQGAPSHPLRIQVIGAFAAAAITLGAPTLSAAAQAPSGATGNSGATEEGPWLTLPDEPMGRSWALVSADTIPWSFLPEREKAAPTGSSSGGAGEPWANWANALKTIDGKAPPTARREASALLMEFAAKDGRPEDAYAWAKTLGAGDPEGVAGTLPYLFPGVPFSAQLGPGGRPLPLPSGTLLSPMLAAPQRPSAPMGIVWREAKARGIRVGGATFDMELKIDNTGIVVDFEEAKGTEAKVRLSLPTPEGYRLKALFIDWEKVPLPSGADPLTFDWAKEPIEISVKERDSTYSVFARIAPLTSSLPTSPKAGDSLPRALLEEGLEIRISGDDPAPWDAISGAWGKAAGVATKTVTLAPGAVPPPPGGGQKRGQKRDQKGSKEGGQKGGLRGTVIDFTSCPDPARLRRQVTAAIESRIRAGS